MTVETTVLGAGGRIKLAHRKVQPEGCPVSYVLELAIEDAYGKDSHRIFVFAVEPVGLYRVVSNLHSDMLTASKDLLESGMLVRQTDEVSLEVAREYFPQPIEDEEDEEDYQVPTQYGQPGEGKTYTEEE